MLPQDLSVLVLEEPEPDPESCVAEIYQPRGFSAGDRAFTVVDIRPTFLRVYHADSEKDAYRVRDAWRRGNFAEAGEKRGFT